ncbi:unnamed protein product [Rhizoctonia solani]|uniref:F-box domain-containing protein n=1 Tax=Rhizoctonia solani TaxID=456999 RepID=A0A8H3GL84_9AGAM|nr:unnamed protein product [Rhizoctonia solani]
MGSPSLPPCPTIVEWEEAGASLVTAFGKYMNLCLNLGTDSLREGATSKDLVSRIDSALAITHAALSSYLNESSSALARTRNKLASPIFRFPEELMSEIFMNVVFNRHGQKSSGSLSLESSSRMIYRRLYSLFGVCSAWRDLILVRGALWSVIPILPSRSDRKHKVIKRILRRVGGSPLHLAVFMEWASPTRLVKVLNEYGPRFRTVNLSASSRYVIRDAMHRLLEHDTPGSLCELSIQFNKAELVNHRTPEESDYLFPRDHIDHVSFASLVGTLTAFRISGLHFHWDTMARATRLVELRIEQITLGYDDALVSLVQALSSAPNLRDLKMISVSTFRDPAATHDRKLIVPVAFPNLKSLFLQDLYFNSLEYLLPIISPGSYRLILFLARKSLEINVVRDNVPGNEEEDIELERVEVSDLGSALVDTPVDTLMITGVWNDCWLTGPEIRLLLVAMPTLKALQISHWDLDHSVWRALRRSTAARSCPEDYRFPALESLYLCSARLINQRGLRNMVASHPLQEVVLGGIFGDTLRQLSESDSCDGDNGVTGWLKTNVPVFRLVRSFYEPPEFYSDVWQLW